MQTTATQDNQKSRSENMHDWFEDIVAQLRTDELQLATNTAPEDKKNMYNAFIGGNFLESAKVGRDLTTQAFVYNLIIDYHKELVSRKVKLKKLSVELNDASIYVWAVIADNDEKSENDLILSEAKTNSKYSEYGFYISSTIVEESDNLNPPSHYEVIK